MQLLHINKRFLVPDLCYEPMGTMLASMTVRLADRPSAPLFVIRVRWADQIDSYAKLRKVFVRQHGIALRTDILASKYYAARFNDSELITDAWKCDEAMALWRHRPTDCDEPQRKIVLKHEKYRKFGIDGLSVDDFRAKWVEVFA